MAINDISQKHNIPWVYGAVRKLWDELYDYPWENSLFKLSAESNPDAGMTCDTAGIIAPAVGMVFHIKSRKR